MQGSPPIMVVEDDRLIQSLVEEALKEGGFETVIVSTAEHTAESLGAGVFTVPGTQSEALGLT